MKTLTHILSIALLTVPVASEAAPPFLLKGKKEAEIARPGPVPFGPPSRARGPVPPPAAATALIGSRAGSGFARIDGPRIYGLPPLPIGRTYMRQGNSIFEVDERSLTVLALAAVLR